MEPPSKDVTILLPAYNEAWRIESCIRAVERAVSAFTNSFEVIVTEDGSTDETVPVVSRLSKKDPNLVLLHSSARLGKGCAIKRGVHEANGAIVVFMDVDLATDLKSLHKLVVLTKERGGMVIGSRHVAGSRVQRPVLRTFFSLSYNTFVGTLFLDGVRDHQCGFKAMSREVANELCKNVKADGFFFDTELILWCRIMGFPLLEMAVSWSEKRTRSESKVKLFHDAYRMGKDLIRFKLDHVSPLIR
jgi:glycosyltransferase involved in cell wall biosynthesis